MKRYTLESDEGGLWILAYVLTAVGHDDMYHRVLKADMTSPYECLVNDEPPIEQPFDPLQENLNDVIEKQFLEDTGAEFSDDDYDLVHEEEEEYDDDKQGTLPQ